MNNKERNKKINKIIHTSFVTYPIPFPLNLYENNISILTNTSAEVLKEKLIYQAFNFHKAGNISEAEKSYKLILNKGFLDPGVLSNYGLICQNSDRINQAIDLYKSSISSFPNKPEAYSNLGVVYKELGNLKDAEDMFKRAIEIKSDFLDALINLAPVLKDQGKIIEAEDVILKAIKYYPKSALAHLNFANILKALGKLHEAEISTKYAIKLNPNLTIGYINLGRILIDLGKINESEECFKKLIQLDPINKDANYFLGRIYYSSLKFEQAINCLNISNSSLSKSLLLGCYLSLDNEKKFDEQYKIISSDKICTPELGGIISHASVIFNKKIDTIFCNDAMNYILIDSMEEEDFTTEDANDLISFFQSENNEKRVQNLLNNGFQSSGNLFNLDYSFIHSLKKAIENKIIKYRSIFQDSSSGFIKEWPNSFYLNGWMVSMQSGGFLKPHNHEEGWLSGSFYLHVPQRDISCNDGSIAFTYQGPSYPQGNNKFTTNIKHVKTRDICMFPSSLFHYTIPFNDTDERICFVFDLHPRY